MPCRRASGSCGTPTFPLVIFSKRLVWASTVYRALEDA